MGIRVKETKEEEQSKLELKMVREQLIRGMPVVMSSCVKCLERLVR